MKAVVAYGAKNYKVEEVEKPVCGDSDLIIKIEAAGICASDRAVYMGGDPWGGIDEARIPGHEFVGIVVEMGEGTKVKRDVKIGDRITAECIMPCGECYYCKRGLYHLCDDEMGFLEGGFAEYMKIPEKALVHKVPTEIPAAEAAMAEPLSCSAYAVDQAEIGMKDTVVISGLGAIGMGMLQFALLKHPYRVIGLDVNDASCELAKKLGADYVFNSAKEDINEAIMEVTGGVGCDVYMEASGSDVSLRTGLEVLRKQGLLFVYSVFKKEALIDFNQISEFKELRVKGGHLSPYAFPYVIKCMERKWINTKVMATDVFPLREIEAAMDRKRSSGEKKLSIKTLLVP